MNCTKIEWTHRPETGGTAGGRTWNPVRARIRGVSQLRASAGTFCTRISPGCTHCYASTINKRFGNGLEYTVPNLEKIEFFIDEKMLEAPLRDKKPRTIFVGDMFDLFHEAIPLSLIGPVLDVAQVANWHTLQFLTKRAKRMQEVFSFRYTPGPPPPHIWAGVSVEDQPRADERIPLLLETPAAVRFLSVEPMLEAVRVDQCAPYTLNGDDSNPGVLNAFTAMCHHPLTVKFAPEKLARPDGISWVICGGESGPGARPFNLAWAESLLGQCRAAGVPFFMKQVGSRPIWKTDGTFHEPGATHVWHDRKGGDPAEWPEALRVREFPAVEMAVQL